MIKFPPSPRNWRSHALCLALFGATMQFACAPDVPQDPKPENVRVQSVLSPTDRVLPLPNSAAVDADQTLPNQGGEQGTAQFVVNQLIDEYAGWPLSTAIEVPFNGELDPGSLNAQEAFLWEIGADGKLTRLDVAELRYSTVEGDGPAKSSVQVVPSAPLKKESRYGVILTTKIKGANGVGTLPSPTLFIGLNDGPIVLEDGTVTVPQLKATPERAQALEGAVRRNVQVLVDNLDEFGLTRQDIVAAFTWRTNTDTSTVLDSASATIPLPNSVALDQEPDGQPTFPAAALSAEYNEWKNAYFMEAGGITEESVTKFKSVKPPSAQATLDRYLDYLHGYTNDVGLLPASIPLDGPIDEATLTADSAQLWKVGADGTPERVTEVTLSYIEDGDSYSIRIQPEKNLELNTNYFAFVTRDIKTAAGTPLLPASAMLLAMQPFPLLDAEGKSLVAQATDANAAQATGLQQLLKPTMEQIQAAASLGYNDLAGVWSWYTWKDPFAVFDPTAGDIPFPNVALIGEDGTANIPIAADADDLSKLLFTEVNTRDGFSVLGNIWVTVLGELDESTLTKFVAGDNAKDDRGSIAMAEVPGAFPAVIAGERYEIDYLKEDNKIVIRPNVPLLQGVTNVGLLSSRIKGTNGLPLQPTSAFVLLGSQSPVADAQGKSLVAQADDATAAAIEGRRQAFTALFQGASIVSGDAREDIAVAFAFNTDNVTEPLQQRRAQVVASLAARNTPPEVRGNDLLDNTDGSSDAYAGDFSRGATVDLSNIAQVQWSAEYDTVATVDEMANALPYAMFAPVKVGATIYVPKTVAGQCEPPFDVVIMHHGLTSDRLTLSLGAANQFAAPETCLAVVAPDAPLHGGRAPGSTDLHPKVFPANSGEGFLTSNFVASKNLFTQGVMDLVSLVEFIRGGALEGAVTDTSGGAGMFSTTKIGIMGNSLGGIFSTDLITIDPNVNAGVLTVAPGKLTYYLTEESLIGDGALPDSIKALKGTFAFDQVMSFVQWVADLIDPAAFANYAIKNRLKALEFNAGDGMFTEGDTVPEPDFLVQMAKDDAVAPNVSTEQLAKILGTDLSKSTYAAPHGFFSQQDNTKMEFKAADCARRQAATFLRAALDGGDTTIAPALESDTCVSN